METGRLGQFVMDKHQLERILSQIIAEPSRFVNNRQSLETILDRLVVSSNLLRTMSFPYYIDRDSTAYFEIIYQEILGRTNIIIESLQQMDIENENLINDWVREFYSKLVEFDWQLLQRKIFPGDE